MKFIKAIIFIFVIHFSTTVLGQVEKIKEFSAAKKALLIDSLENCLTTSSDYENANLIFELAILYNHIDLDQSEKYAIKYLAIKDSIFSVEKRKIIYGMLSQMFKQKGNGDSSYYYLSMQYALIDSSFDEKNEILKRKYLGNIAFKKNEKGFLGLSSIQQYLILGSGVLLIMVIIYFWVIKRRFRKEEAKKNIELEEANIKFIEFNESIEQAVINNIKTHTSELEKSNNKFIELRKSLKKAEESNYLKNAFLGSMSHQIRTPLSGIMGFSDLLEIELAVMGNEELYEYAKNIQESGDKLMNLITNIIDISSIEANLLELNISSCDVNKIIKDFEKTYLFKAREKGLVFKTKLDTSLSKISADKNNLVKVLDVILDNALKFTNKGFVTVSTKYNSNNTATIEIKDKGIGIDDKTLEMLLNSFDYEKHRSLLTYQGRGLGLILAHRLINLMNGKLEITSKVGKGSEVSVTLPCMGASEKDDDTTITISEEASIVSAPEYGRIKIFIVEDDRMNRLVLEKMLKKSGDITLAIDGNDALKVLEKSSKSGQKFDVMLIDINLPEPWDGVMLMKEIKKEFPYYKNLPFIAQTAYAMAEDKDLYIDAGFNDYISKPINKNELLTMIQQQFEISKKETAVES